WVGALPPSTTSPFATLGRDDWYMNQSPLIVGRNLATMPPLTFPLASRAIRKWQQRPGFDFPLWGRSCKGNERPLPLRAAVTSNPVSLTGLQPSGEGFMTGHERHRWRLERPWRASRRMGGHWVGQR